jgi:pilus assembly protein Flp/PilA
MKHIVADFCREDSGAQVVEYALVIALLSIGLALALSSTLGTGAGAAFDTLVTRVKNCFTTGSLTC